MGVGGGGERISQDPGLNNVGMIGHTSAEDTNFLGGVRGHTTEFEIPNCWKCNEIVNPTITTIFCIILNILRSHQVDLFAPRASPPCLRA